MKVYIAGPISADATRTFEEKCEAFYEVERALMKSNHEPVNPLRLDPVCGLTPEECVGRSVFPERNKGQKKHSWECYMKTDLIALLGCDAIYPLNFWQVSPGARIEVELAGQVGIPWVVRD